MEARKEITEGRTVEIVLELVLFCNAPKEALARGRNVESSRAAPGVGPGLEDWRGPSLGEFKKKTPCGKDVGVRDGGRDVENGTPSVDGVVYAVWIESLDDQVINCALDLDHLPVP